MCPIEEFIKWNQERQLTKFSGEAEYVMLVEELQEFFVAHSEGDVDMMIDALCDIVVVATGGIHKLGYDPKVALLETAKEINSRVGSFDKSAGKWKKDPNQDPNTLYKADYSSARR